MLNRVYHVWSRMVLGRFMVLHDLYLLDVCAYELR